MILENILENIFENNDEPREPNRPSEPEIAPPKYPHIDIPQNDPPQAPIQTPESPVPVRA